MYVLFLRPILENILGIKNNISITEYYQFDESCVEKVTDSLYEIKDFNICADNCMELFYTLNCLPIMIAERSDCEEFEKTILQYFNNLHDRDIIWIEPLQHVIDGKRIVATLFNILSNRVFLVSGKSFQRATEIDRNMIGCVRYNYKLLNYLVNTITYEELGTDVDVKNYAKTIVNIMNIMQYNSFESIITKYFNKGDIFHFNDKAIFCDIDDRVVMFKNMDSLVEYIMSASIGAEDIIKTSRVIARTATEVKSGIWTTSTGVKHRVNTNQAMQRFLNQIKDAYDDIEVTLFIEEDK